MWHWTDKHCCCCGHMAMQERSFKEFAARPENKPLLEQHQQQEVAAALELQEQQQLALLQQQVSCLAYDTAGAIGRELVLEL